MVALAHTVHYNIDIEEYLKAVMQFGATVLFIRSHKRRSPNTPLLFYCPVAFLTLTLSQWQNALWGFQMAWYLVLLSLALTIALLDWPQLATGRIGPGRPGRPSLPRLSWQQLAASPPCRDCSSVPWDSSSCTSVDGRCGRSSVGSGPRE